ncbi:MAG: RNA-binding S4 domain-containing protein [Bacilli bacterium]|nr:RNA-binding S4 domain-containing protein [Bacilli bacterium]MDD3422449.1 RNA-binding S4 domain-containing protein [Bacilli bacterium]MDD4065689.1 RNA-binding S4 domain-containing protein [Bacilli bacterium]
MRIDKYLKVARIVKRRTVCKELADNGRININGRLAKAGTEIHENDIIELQLSDRNLTIKVLNVKEYASKDETISMYEVVAETMK